MKNLNTLKTLMITATLLAAGGSAMAQATLDHNKALAGNSLPGDAPGYPITLSQPGHYVLKSNLQVPAGLNGIEITGKNVTLDLNGFGIMGTGDCIRNDSTKVVTCTGTVGSPIGVRVVADAVTIRNGTVSGFEFGIDLVYLGNGTQGGVVLADLLLTRNLRYGLASNASKGPHLRASGLIATLNGENGMRVSNGLIERSQANNNGGDGFDLNSQVVSLLDSFAYGNRFAGVRNGVLRGVNVQLNGTNRIGGLSMGGNMDGGMQF
ncbi:hypothetical protein LNV08_15485 [Paucibacter sp. TC2R-5]|uniref:hypothetical protein n=1 Tax=Paucibacter sp. TC2R-5 TaxID=2893555 RepID=UPI0021E3B2D2|nr:hypothetical protein [Paucibacter sp. TC2R-5]MCV2360378.1 hypothetical protein [Paucibacter sp. TC2R-5]